MSWVVQLVGFFGLLLVALSFQSDRRSRILGFQSVAALLFSLHFLLLGAFSGAAMNLLSSARAASFEIRRRPFWLLYGFLGAFWIAGLLTWQAWYSILPVISMSIESFALFSDDTKRLRMLIFAARPTWILYDVLVGSWAALATEFFIIGSLLVARNRFDAR